MVTASWKRGYDYSDHVGDKLLTVYLSVLTVFMWPCLLLFPTDSVFPIITTSVCYCLHHFFSCPHLSVPTLRFSTLEIPPARQTQRGGQV